MPDRNRRSDTEMKILVVDDSSVMRKLVARSVRHAGYRSAELQEAADGVEALGLVDEFNPDVILADWNMPAMTGIEMLRTLRSNGNTVKVVFITSETAESSRKAAISAGATDFLTKPFAPEDLAEILDA